MTEKIDGEKVRDAMDILFSNFNRFLKEKNKRYGNSAISPMQIFSKVEPNTKICSRLDEKLQRIMNSTELKKNDVCDVFGYTALLLIQKGWLDFDDQLD